MHEYYAYVLRYINRFKDKERENNDLVEINKQRWEQSRFIVWSIFQHVTKKKIDPTEIKEFGWDDKQANVKDWINKMKDGVNGTR